MDVYLDMSSGAISDRALKRGVVLFAHGARDPRWAEPLEAIALRLRMQAPALEVATAYLELMTPDLAGAVALLAGRGCGEITVVPVFLGQGGHVRRDLPARLEEVRRMQPGLDLRLTEAVGEDAHVLDAIAAFCLREVAATPAR